MKNERRFTPEQVVDMRRRYAVRKTNMVELAAETGASLTVVWRMIKGITYRDVGGPTFPRRVLDDSNAHVLNGLLVTED